MCDTQSQASLSFCREETNKDRCLLSSVCVFDGPLFGFWMLSFVVEPDISFGFRSSDERPQRRDVSFKGPDTRGFHNFRWNKLFCSEGGLILPSTSGSGVGGWGPRAKGRGLGAKRSGDGFRFWRLNVRT